MKDHINQFCLKKMAKTLRVSRSGYYKYLKEENGKRKSENDRLIQKIHSIHKKSRCRYGSPRIYEELKKVGETCSRKRVAKLMRQEKIQSQIRKKWKVTTKRDPKAKVAPNHVNQNFSVQAPNKVWVSDITYIETLEGWLYLTVILDLFSRKVVGSSMGKSLETSLVIRALEQALCHRKPEETLMHHSDRGCQYTSKEFLEFTQKNNIILSMSAQGHCYDNAVAESFFHTLKTEYTNHQVFKTRQEALIGIFEYIEIFYNRERLHSFLGYQSPVEYEEKSLSENRITA